MVEEILDKTGVDCGPCGALAVAVVFVRAEAEPVPLVLGGGQLHLHSEAGHHGGIADRELTTTSSWPSSWK